MGRPRTISDERLLAATGASIGRLGPAFTLADVAAEAGVSAGTLVGRFGSKEGLLDAATALGTTATVAAMRVAAIRAGGGAGGVRAALAAAAADLDDAATAANHLAQLHADLASPRLREAVRRHHAAVRAVVADLVEAAGDLPAAPAPAGAAEALEAIWTGTLLAWSLEPAGALTARVERAVDHLLGAWAGPDARGRG